MDRKSGERSCLLFADCHYGWNIIYLKFRDAAWDFARPVGATWLEGVGRAVGGEFVRLGIFEDDVRACEAGEQRSSGQASKI